MEIQIHFRLTEDLRAKLMPYHLFDEDNLAFNRAGAKHRAQAKEFLHDHYEKRNY